MGIEQRILTCRLLEKMNGIIKMKMKNPMHRTQKY